MGFIKPDSGEITVNNFDAIKDRNKIMKFTGFISSDLGFYENMKVKDFLNIIQILKNEKDDEWKLYLLDFFELDSQMKIKKLSRGNKQKVLIFCYS